VELPVNRFKRAILAGAPQIGLWNSLSSPVAVEVIAGSGFDWILLDTEHAQTDLPLLHAQLQAMMEHPETSPIVRVPWNDMVTIKRYLDAGVQSLLIPYVQNEREAADAVRYTRYPPRGVRGFAGSSRATRFGRIRDYHTRASDEICVLVQVETLEAVAHLDSIAAVEGVDGIFVGPGDLSASMGHLGDLGHPEVRKLVDDTLKRIRKAGKAPGIITGDEALARHYLEIGALFVAVGADVGVLARGTEALAAKFRSPAS
jgi:4-hydroxy-2-oxoheptanedioate aldolase